MNNRYMGRRARARGLHDICRLRALTRRYRELLQSSTSASVCWLSRALASEAQALEMSVLRSKSPDLAVFRLPPPSASSPRPQGVAATSQKYGPQPDLPEMTDLRRGPHRSRQNATGMSKRSRTVQRIQSRESSRGRRTILLLCREKAGTRGSKTKEFQNRRNQCQPSFRLASLLSHGTERADPS